MVRRIHPHVSPTPQPCERLGAIGVMKPHDVTIGWLRDKPPANFDKTASWRQPRENPALRTSRPSGLKIKVSHDG
jgi:hypothetical protein